MLEVRQNFHTISFLFLFIWMNFLNGIARQWKIEFKFRAKKMAQLFWRKPKGCWLFRETASRGRCSCCSLMMELLVKFRWWQLFLLFHEMVLGIFWGRRKKSERKKYLSLFHSIWIKIFLMVKLKRIKSPVKKNLLPWLWKKGAWEGQRKEETENRKNRKRSFFVFSIRTFRRRSGPVRRKWP